MNGTNKTNSFKINCFNNVITNICYLHSTNKLPYECYMSTIQVQLLLVTINFDCGKIFRALMNEYCLY